MKTYASLNCIHRDTKPNANRSHAMAVFVLLGLYSDVRNSNPKKKVLSAVMSETTLMKWIFFLFIIKEWINAKTAKTIDMYAVRSEPLEEFETTLKSYTKDQRTYLE